MILSQVRATDYNPRIVLIDNDVVQLEGFSIILSSNKNFKIVKAYNTAEDAIRNIRRDIPDIIFMDLALADEDGISAIKRLKKLHRRTHIIAFTEIDNLNIIFEAFAAGTSGYLLKGGNHVELLNAVAEIMNNGAPMSSKIAKLVVSSFQRSPNSPLSDRETEILSSLAMGKTYKVTANNLHIGMETVKSHVKNIYSKLNVSSKVEAIELARQRSLI